MSAILAKLRDLAQEVATEGGHLHELHLGGTGTQAVVAELNAEQGRDIDPPEPGHLLPPGTDPARVKFKDASVLYVDGIHIRKGEARDMAGTPSNTPPMTTRVPSAVPAPQPATGPDAQPQSGVKVPGMTPAPQKSPDFQGEPTL